jgi:hypothetical protein
VSFHGHAIAELCDSRQWRNKLHPPPLWLGCDLQETCQIRQSLDLGGHHGVLGRVMVTDRRKPLSKGGRQQQCDFWPISRDTKVAAPSRKSLQELLAQPIVPRRSKKVQAVSHSGHSTRRGRHIRRTRTDALTIDTTARRLSSRFAKERFRFRFIKADGIPSSSTIAWHWSCAHLPIKMTTRGSRRFNQCLKWVLTQLSACRVEGIALPTVRHLTALQ